MKKILKILLYLILAVVIIVAAIVLYIYVKGVPNYPYQPTAAIQNLKVTPDSIRIARGAKIATLLCNNCHADPKTGMLTGKHISDAPDAFGYICSYNITHDKSVGIGNWTDGELYYFLRTGIRKDGSWAPPFMPKFPLTADEDLYSIIAWLRSDDPHLAASTAENPPNQYNLFLKFLSNIAFKPPALPAQVINIPDTSDQVAFGKYVADGLCACFACHSVDFAKMDIADPPKSVGYYGGGNPLLNLDREIVHSANITMDKETGIGNWNKDQFIAAVKYCKKPQGGLLSYPMFPHATLSDTEVSAIWAYLHTIPKIKNKVERYQPKDG